jgi:Bacterial capsule synthesis protein PGA_cap
MVNLDRSWQASVIKLAQAGNSRAIAFWMNRYLVPQGICAQVETGQAGCLMIRVVCRQAPDCDRLVRFICHRLCKLDSDMIQQVQISAQIVGSTTVLWQKSARIIPSAERKAQAQPISSPTASQVAVFPQAAPTAAVGQMSQPLEAGSRQTQPASGKQRFSLPAMPKLKFGPFPQYGTQLPQSWPAWQQTLQEKMASLQTTSLDLTDRTFYWIAHQKPATRALMLGGSAVAAFLIGCSFELAGYYTDPETFQRSKATLTRMIQSASAQSGSVKTALEPVPVIRQPVLNPDDPTISLIFSNSATLTRLPASQLRGAPTQAAAGAPPLINGIETFRLADMIVTNLSNPFDSSSPSIAKPAEKAVEEPESLSLPEAEAPHESNPDAAVLGDGMVLQGLPSEEELEGSWDGETEKGRFAEEADGDPAEEAEQEWVQPEKKRIPVMPQELLANGVDIVNVASNAVMPEGVAQLAHTLDRLRQDGIYPVGAGQNGAEARRPQIFAVKGQRIAYLGYSDSSAYPVGTAEAGVNVSVNQQMEQDIKAIRDQVDWIVISVTWNRELRAYPEDWQVNLAHAAIDHGADLVVGYHPTVTQGAEIYNGRAIAYSLGDSIDEYSEKPAGDYDTAALKVTIKEHIMELEFLPIKVKRGRAEVAKGELGTTILQYVEQASSLFDHPLRSPASLNSQLRLSLPAAPDSTMPTDPFIHYSEPPAQSPIP